MSFDLNDIKITGRLTKNVELRYSSAGLAIVTMSVAVNGLKDGEVSFFNVVVFGKVAENCETYLAKGSKVLVSGKMKQESYDKDGEKKTVWKLIGNSVMFLDSKKDSNKKEKPEKKDGKDKGYKKLNEMSDDIDDDLPYDDVPY